MLSAIIPTLIANLATTGCALLLVRKGPTRRLKILTFTVGLMSLAQTASFFHTQGFYAAGITGVSYLNQILAAGLSMVAMVVLAREIHDRTQMDRKLRLVELEAPAAEIENASPKAKEPSPDQIELHQVSTRATTDLLMMLTAISSDDNAAHPPAKSSSQLEECPRCQQIAREMAAAWLEVHLYMENREADTDRLHNARLRVARAVQTKRQHELRSGHELPLMKSSKESVNGAYQLAG